ncbi:hypothetical protein FA15DRAFT_704647 [Coprinopsis marcescibilis]|uniref:Uncharacterized protein n=1 Tax=Coprinopsis marcescibilis TaxID=230819 RepID=A0A5C3KVE6_COPMA|nr:hypothetical protein FA15DRAFT_704647 [Coprinopsis marcescibilis]
MDDFNKFMDNYLSHDSELVQSIQEYHNLLIGDSLISEAIDEPIPLSSVLDWFHQFIDASIDIGHTLQAGEDMGNIYLTTKELIEIIKEDLDLYIGVRELSPGRQRSQSDEGPYALKTIHSKSGIFSAIVWRVVTYSTMFSREWPMVFSNPEHAKEIIKTAREIDDRAYEDEYFCWSSAYSNCINQRRMEVIDQAWSWLGESSDEWLALESLNPTFLHCYDFFQPPEMHSGRFPTLGKYCTFQLICDLHYAGVCQAPTFDDLARHIVDCNRTSLNTLRKLGVVTESGQGNSQKARILAVREGIQQVQKHLNSVIRASSSEILSSDWIGIKHLLTSFRQLISQRRICGI